MDFVLITTTEVDRCRLNLHILLLSDLSINISKHKLIIFIKYEDKQKINKYMKIDGKINKYINTNHMYEIKYLSRI